MFLNVVASVFLGSVSYMIWLKGNGPHQTVKIVCGCT